MASEPFAYSTDVADLTPTDLEGFFVGWAAKPSPERHLAILRGSDYVVIAREGHDGRVVGFITAISDGVLSAFIPLLEVLPEFQGRGIGTGLVRRMLEELEAFSMVDLVCDPDLEPFYRRFEMMLLAGMSLRRRRLLAD